MKMPDNAVARYRIMTEKSVLGFGKYGDLPIGEIMKVDREYLVWTYFHFDKISYHERILGQLGCRRIAKPGHDDRELREYNKARFDALTDDRKQIVRFSIANGKRKHAKSKLYQAIDDTYYSKRQLQAINHGKMRRK